jgi:hypothetical protein
MKIFIILLLVISPKLIFCQQPVSYSINLNIDKKEIERLNTRLFSLLKKNKLIVDIPNTDILNIYWMSINEPFIKKEDLLNKHFINDIKISFYQLGKIKKKRYIKTSKSFIFTKSNNKLIANGDARIVKTYSECSPILKEEYTELFNLMQSKDFVLFFEIVAPYPIFCITKDNEIFTIYKDKNKKLNIYTLEKFIKCFYDDWMFPWKKKE